MRHKRREWSYYDTKKTRKKRIRRLRIILLWVCGYLLFTSYGATSLRIDSGSMLPTLALEDRVVYLTLPYKGIFSSTRLFAHLPKRGDVVVMRLPFVDKKSWWKRAFTSFLGFVTFQRVLLGERETWDSSLYIRRVIGIPGDIVEMEDFVARVRPQGARYFLSEFEVSGTPYDLRIEDLPLGWREEYPLSGKTSARLLGDDEYFLLADNRTAASDSRDWGPLSRRHLSGVLFLRYWPLREIGQP